MSDTLSSPCFEADTGIERTPKLLALPLDAKIIYTKMLIQRFFVAMKGKVYVSFSGGKDSTVLLDVVRSVYPDVPAVYIDTGLEFPELRDHVKTVDNVVWLKPEKTFKQVRDLPYASVYDMGYERTGCIFCCFGITMERDRFLKLKATHPRQWAYCMKPVSEGGLGMKDVLDYMGIPTGCEQTNLIEWAREQEASE